MIMIAPLFVADVQNFIAPPPLKAVNSSNDKIVIMVSADIIDILEINEISSIFQVCCHSKNSSRSNKKTNEASAVNIFVVEVTMPVSFNFMNFKR